MLIQKRLVKNEKGKVKHLTKNRFQQFTFNLRPGKLREEVLNGRKYLVAPMVMMTVGVHEGSEGPILYEDTDLELACPAWNHKPIVVHHPKKGSACDPSILNSSQVGLVLNTEWDGKQRTEAWFEDERIDKVDKRIRKALNKKEVMEVSTGLFMDVESVEGDWEGEHYDGIARNHRPDHLALLPDGIGACSVEDGAGLFQLNAVGVELLANHEQSIKKGLFSTLTAYGGLQHFAENEMSHSAICRALGELLRDSMTSAVNGMEWNGWIEDVFDTYFVYWQDGKLMKQGYLATDTKVELVGDPDQVTRDVRYVVVSNSEENDDMAKAKKSTVDKLIANESTKWEDEDREFLTSLTEEQLQKFDPVANEDPEDDEDDEEEEQPKPAKNAKGKKAKKKPVVVENEDEDDEEVSEAEYMKKLPPAMRRIVANGIEMEKRERTRLIGIITKNQNSVFTKDDLKDRDINDLFKLAKLAESTQPKQSQSDSAPNYLGLGLPIGNSAADDEEEEEAPLETPTMNFENHRNSPKKKMKREKVAVGADDEDDEE